MCLYNLLLIRIFIVLKFFGVIEFFLLSWFKLDVNFVFKKSDLLNFRFCDFFWVKIVLIGKIKVIYSVKVFLWLENFFFRMICESFINIF